MISDSGSGVAPATVDLTAAYVLIAPLGDLEGVLVADGAAADLTAPINIVRRTLAAAPLKVLERVRTRGAVESRLSKTGGALIYDGGKVWIPAATPPGGQTLSLILAGSDGASDAERRARPNRLYTLHIVYSAARAPLAATAVADGQAINSALVRYVGAAAATPLLAASLTATGGSGGYNFAITGDLELRGREVHHSGEHAAAGRARK